MTPIEIVRKLEGYKSLTSQKKLLAGIPPEDNFWFEAHHGLSHFTPYPIRFVLQEQKHAGLVDYASIPNVLRMILTSMFDGTLDEKTLPQAITALSLRARPDEWREWFEPVLTKSLTLPVDVTTFNHYAPEVLRVPGLPVAPQMDISGVNSMPAEFYLEPLIEGEHVLWFLENDGVSSYLADGTRWEHYSNRMFEDIIHDKLPVSLVLEGYMEDESITLVDINNRTLFMEGGKNHMQLRQRYEALREIEAMLETFPISTFMAVESHLCKLSDATTTREAFNTIMQQGYSGAVLRHDHGPRVIVKPTRKSVLTCSMITAGSGKYEGAAEYIVGDGTMNRKRFSSPVFSGLTFDERKTILENRNDYIGKKYEVVSCGIGQDNKLLFPVFKQWRK